MALHRLMKALGKSENWTCDVCGSQYPEGSCCPLDDQHWEHFVAGLRVASSAPRLRHAAA